MKRWAIAIGINQYHFLQPLSFAQQDAQAFHNFLIKEAEFAPANCLLLTDASAPIGDQLTTPTKEGIQGWLKLLSEKYIQPGDLVWLFCSGYGVCDRGRDYLVPIDGHPGSLQKTAIAIESIFRWLKTLPTDETLVILDISRSQSSIPDELVGIQTAYLANQMHIPTILSCQPGQFSHETVELGHGFFTRALLEGLHSQPFATFAELEQYLNVRLPELTQHHYHPIQRSQVVVPDSKLQQSILPGGDAPTQLQSSAHYREPNGSYRWIEEADSAKPDDWARTAIPTEIHPVDKGQTAVAVQPNADGKQIANDAPVELENADADEVVYRRSPLFWGGITAASLLLAFAVGMKNWASITQGAPISVASNQTQFSSASIRANSSQSPAEGQAGSSSANSGTPSAASLRAEQPQTVAQAPSLSDQAIAPRSDAVPPSSPESNQTAAPVSLSMAVAARPGVTQAQDLGAKIQRQTFSVPTVQQSTAKPAQLNVARSKVKVVNSDQASPYWYAIQEANKIQPSDPDYAQAQVEISQWSQNILAIAQRRANRKSFDTAILAAALVPQNLTAYAEVEKSFDRWCPSLNKQTIKNPTQWRQAQAICQQ